MGLKVCFSFSLHIFLTSWATSSGVWVTISVPWSSESNISQKFYFCGFTINCYHFLSPIALPLTRIYILSIWLIRIDPKLTSLFRLPPFSNPPPHWYINMTTCKVFYLYFSGCNIHLDISSDFISKSYSSNFIYWLIARTPFPVAHHCLLLTSLFYDFPLHCLSISCTMFKFLYNK
jgi:hypothetical protein